MSWLALVGTLLALVRSLIEYLRERRLIEAGTAEVLLKSNREQQDAIDQAKAAREQVRADLARGADPMSDDEFRRD